MAYGSKYQYGTSPRKISPEYSPQRRTTVKTNKTRQTTVKKTSTRKNTSKTTKKKNISLEQKAKLKQERKMKRNVIFIVGLIFAVLFVISYRSSKISANFAEIKELKKGLEAIEKENEQLSVGIESDLNLNNIEKIAEEKLGMQKLKSDQIVYVNLPKEDYIQPASEKVKMEENKNFLQKILDEIF